MCKSEGSVNITHYFCRVVWKFDVDSQNGKHSEEVKIFSSIAHNFWRTQVLFVGPLVDTPVLDFW